MYHTRVAKLILIITISFLILVGAGLFAGSQFISRQMLLANENTAMDIALLVKNNFSITDEEVSYMKSLTFNEMEVDPVNHRLMDIVNDLPLNAAVSNVYLVAALQDDEIKYTADDSVSAFMGYAPGTPLDVIWLLNGKFDEKGKFQVARRGDIYRYTHLTGKLAQNIRTQNAFCEYGADVWGKFITGYVPIYTMEGNFVGQLGIDISPDKYQSSVRNMIYVLLAAFVATSLVMSGLRPERVSAILIFIPA